MPAQAEKRLLPFQQEVVPDSSALTPSSTPIQAQPSPARGQQAGCTDSELFESILFSDLEMSAGIDGLEAPEIFPDLLLDQIVESITAGRDEYNLKPFFYTPLGCVEAVNFRFDVLRDLESPFLDKSIRSFAHEMRRMRDCLRQAEKLYYKYQKLSWFLDAVEIYCGAIRQLNHDLTHTSLGSGGFRGFRGFLASYVESDYFTALAGDAERLRADLGEITYSLHIAGPRVAVSKYEPAADYGADVLSTFQKFSQGVAKEYRFNLQSVPDMNHVEAAVLDLVARLYPGIFSSLEAYCARQKNYLNSTVARFDREVQFYLACLEHVQHLKHAGLAFCYPVVSDRSKEVYGRSVFDLALAKKLTAENAPVITNDFYLKDPERVLVVSGPNQGGKTTFARTFGQLHYLAGIGCPVPGTEAKLFLFDRLFTHFEREEDIRNLSGKLEDELLRIQRILECATPNSILIMNESFLSTTLDDALFLSKAIMRRIVALGMLCVSVTFLEELATYCENTVSMVSKVNPKDPARRTFKVVRRSADGLAYAAAIAEKYRLTHDAVRARIAGNRKERFAS
jgi:DNA mismatch repair protein MutS